MTTQAIGIEQVELPSVDEFDFDVRISVLPETTDPQAAFTIWLSCRGGSCSGTCVYCGSPNGGSTNGCC